MATTEIRGLLSMVRETRNSEFETVTIGELARRWHVDPSRITALIADGCFPGAFRIPSAGRFGETVKIPLSDVREAQRQWTIQSDTTSHQIRQPQRPAGSPLRNFPELNSESDAECPEAGEH